MLIISETPPQSLLIHEVTPGKKKENGRMIGLVIPIVMPTLLCLILSWLFGIESHYVCCVGVVCRR